MPEYIDVAAARAFVEANYQGDPLLRHLYGTLLEKLPKVEPVAHGKWERGSKANWQMPMCSECKAQSTSRHKYCPHCGAKMEDL